MLTNFDSHLSVVNANKTFLEINIFLKWYKMFSNTVFSL